MAKSSWQKRAKDRGARFEGKTAKLLPGAYIWTGHDGDVRYPAPNGELWFGECKYIGGYEFYKTTTFEEFLQQVERYVTTDWPKGAHWFLSMTGGRRAMHRPLSKSGTLILISAEEFVRLTSKEE